jgi:hypothetical protein
MDDFLNDLTPWPDMSEVDLPFWVSHGLGELNNWRDLVQTQPQSIFAAPIAALARSGRTVVAATGNARGYVYDPAFRENVFSVSFFRVERAFESLMEEARSEAPTYSQSEFSDFGIIQPAGVLGSSFATPLISGFAALMESREDLRGYANLSVLEGYAEQLMVRLEKDSHNWSDRHDGIVDKLFLKAVRASPHSHFDQGTLSPCPECALFAAGAFINYGLFKLNWGDLDGAEFLLNSAEAFAPANPHAAANLGMVYAVRAQRAQKDGNSEEVSRLLKIAARLQQKASELRPEFEPYQQRVKEFMLGAQHPLEWEMAP